MQRLSNKKQAKKVIGKSAEQAYATTRQIWSKNHSKRHPKLKQNLQLQKNTQKHLEKLKQDPYLQINFQKSIQKGI